MPVDSDAIEHFRLGREALVRKRREIDEAIRGVDKILSDILEGGQGSLPGIAPQPKGPTTQGLTVRAGIMQVLSTGDPFPVAAILAILPGWGVHAQESSVRSILNKLVHEGKLEQPGRGQYQLPRPTDIEGDKT